MTPRQRPPAAPRSLLLPLLLLCTLQRAQGIPIGGSEQQEQQQQKWVGGAGEAIRSSGLGLVPSALLQWPTREEFGGPPDVTSEAELKALGPFIAPILYGGLGNVLFQLAALIKHSQDTDLPLVIGFFKHWNRKLHTFDPWGGHTPPLPGLTLKHAFPRLRWLTFEPPVVSSHVFNRYAFKLGRPDDYAEMPDAALAPMYIHGYFFNYRHWHAARAEVLRILALHPAIQRYTDLVYGDWLRSGAAREPVSLHLRLGYAGEPASGLLRDRRLPPEDFYQRVFDDVLGTADKLYLVFSDNPDKARAMMQAYEAQFPGLRWQLVDENVLTSIHLMARCTHHVLTSSTLSFWGAYLDHKQPQGGLTVLHTSFFVDHGRNMIPPDFHWRVLGDAPKQG